MRRLRTTSTPRLLTILACAGVLATTAVLAQAALGGAGPVPAPKALALAIRDAFGAPAPNGVTARITFTNNLLPGSLPGASSALTSGADGRLWLAQDGAFRLELQSGSGDVQIAGDERRVMLFDSAANTVYRAALPQMPAGAPKHDRSREKPSVATIQKALDRLAEMWTVSGADPTSSARRPAYEVRIAPKDDGGLLGAAEVAWDAVTGVPLRAAIYAQGQDDPVLELEATEISYDTVAGSDVATSPPAGAKVVELNPSSKQREGRESDRDRGGSGHEVVSGIDAVRRALGFELAAPGRLAGLPRRGVHLVDVDGRRGALVTYGKGLGAIVVYQHEAGDTGAKPASRGHGDSPLPQINIDGATGTELATALGTIVTFERGGVAYVVAGSVPPVAAENAARGLR